MFGKLKEKLGSWLKATKEKFSSEEEKQEKKIKPKKPTKAKKEKKTKIKNKKNMKGIEEEIPQEVPKTKKQAEEEIKETQEKVEEIEEIEEEIKGIEEEIPQEVPKTKKQAEEEIKETQEKVEEIEKEIEEVKDQIEEEKSKKGFFSRLKSSFTYKITEDSFNELFDDLEMLLLENNVALEVVEDIRKKLSEKLIGKEIKKSDLEKEIKTELKNTLNEIIIDPDDPLDIIKLKKAEGKPFVILFFGINGTGKTTSIAKLTHLLKRNNISVVLAAADTFRAASIEQLQIHADKLKVPLVKHDYGSDPSAVGFDAIKYAEKHKINVVLIDTAGRMHTKSNLLAEMKKICRVTNPDLKIFVAESIAGNDAVEQAKSFNEMIEIDGSILSKADIDEKGGTIISISHTTKKPIFYLGTGQEYDKLELFNKQKFIEKLGL
jgi:fused signal recognition particle receptor